MSHHIRLNLINDIYLLQIKPVNPVILSTNIVEPDFFSLSREAAKQVLLLYKLKTNL